MRMTLMIALQNENSGPVVPSSCCRGTAAETFTNGKAFWKPQQSWESKGTGYPPLKPPSQENKA